MKDFIEVVKDKDSSCCPDLDFKTRVIGFGITFIVGIVLLIMSFGAFGGLLSGTPGWFAFLYASGNTVALAACFFLIGPKRQLQNMKHPTRLVVSIILVVSIVMTLISALLISSKLLTIIFIIIQFISLTWYVLSYIPYGREFCTKCMKQCCCGEKSEGSSMPIL